MRRKFLKIIFIGASCGFVLPAFSAKPVELSQQDMRILHAFAPSAGLNFSAAGSDLKETSQARDFKQTLHIRLRQTYYGYPVWGSEGIVHIPNATKSSSKFMGLMGRTNKEKGTMNGVLYQDLHKDLQNSPAIVFSDAQAEKALQLAIADYQANRKIKGEMQDKQSQLMVYIDDEQKAHWAFHVSFYLEAIPAAPNYLVDATNFKIYEAWNDVKRLNLEKVKGGGFGGNTRIGKLVYDGLQGNLSKLDMKRDPVAKVCYLANDEVSISDFQTNKLANFPCEATDPSHDNIYWDGEKDAVNGGYSPDNDALYAGKVVVDLYKAWYDLPVLTINHKPMLLEMVMHSPNIDEDGEPDPDNALWNAKTKKMYFGDGETVFFPLPSVGVTAHEVSHGFTEQNSNLYYAKQPGGMNESFSDMAAQAAEFFVRDGGDPSWQIGGEIMKMGNQSLRYLDVPSKDCYETRIPGERCSIDKVKDYDRYVRDHRYDTFAWTRYPNVHYSSGVFNRIFYLMATAPEWGTKKEAFRKAFNVMVQANQHYWTMFSSFKQGACGVLSAAKDLGYDDKPIRAAFDDVGIEIKGSC